MASCGLDFLPRAFYTFRALVAKSCSALSPAAISVARLMRNNLMPKGSKLPRFMSQNYACGYAIPRVPFCDVILEGREQIIHGG